MTNIESPALRQLWTWFSKENPRAQLGGICVAKKGYHSSRDYNDAYFPGNYSVVIAPDEVTGILAGYGSAIDLTMQYKVNGVYVDMHKYSKRLLDSSKDPKDPRLDVLREWYGNVGGDGTVEGWDCWYGRAATSDTSHLWHIHLSFLRKYCNDLNAMRAVLSVLKGQTYSQYLGGSEMSDPLYQYMGYVTRTPPDTGKLLPVSTDLVTDWQWIGVPWDVEYYDPEGLHGPSGWTILTGPCDASITASCRLWFGQPGASAHIKLVRVDMTSGVEEWSSEAWEWPVMQNEHGNTHVSGTWNVRLPAGKKLWVYLDYWNASGPCRLIGGSVSSLYWRPSV